MNFTCCGKYSFNFKFITSLSDVEFITTVDEVKTVTALEHTFWSFNTIYRGGEDNEEEIPTFILKSEKNKSLDKATQLQGLLWLTGYLVRN